MKNITLESVLEKLINEGHESAKSMLHDWFVAECCCIENDLNGVVESGEDLPVPAEFGGDVAAEPVVDGGEDLPVDAEGTTTLPELEARIEDLEADVFGEEEGEEGEAKPEAFGGSDSSEDEEDEDAEVKESNDSEEDDELEEGFDFSDLEESFDHYDGVVPAVNMNGGKEIGSGGAKVAVQDKSPIPQEKVDQRAFRGKPTEIHAEENNSYEREAAPGVKPYPIKGNNTQKGVGDKLSKVSKEGDKSAMLNSATGHSPESATGIQGAPGAPKTGGMR